MQSARQQMGQARRAAQQGRNEDAQALMMQAVAQASEWSCIWLQGARVAYQLGEDALAVQYLSVAFSQNSAWIAEELGYGRYPALGGDPAFHRWISQAQQKHLVEQSRTLAACDASSLQERLENAAMLLEAGNPKETISVLSACSEKFLQDGGAQALFAEAYANNGDQEKALASCLIALKFKPADPRLLALRMSLEQRH
jgi:tetratricopeptide (TPR) repeat protein